jgi:transglutaminase-like putative cysteine protease
MKPLIVCWCLVGLGVAPAPASPVDGDWFIVTGRNAVSSSNPNHPVCKKLAERGKKDEIKDVVFTANDDWAILFGNNGVDWTRASAALGQKVEALWKGNHVFKSLAFPPQGGWVLLYDKNDFAADGIPASALAELRAVKKAGGTLRSIAFPPQGGWVLLGVDGVREEGMPDDLTKRLAEHLQKRIPVRCVSFTSQGDWFLVNDRNECLGNNTGHPAYKALQQLRAKGEVVKCIAFSPGESASGYRLECKPVQRVKAVLDYGIDEPDGKVEEWYLYAPQAPALDRQRDVKTSFVPGGQPVEEFSPLKRTLLLSRVKGKPKGVQVQLIVEATLHSTRLQPRSRGVAAAKLDLDAKLAALYTQSSETMKFKAKDFQEWLAHNKLKRGDKESDLRFARRAFQFLKQNFRYEYKPEGMDRHPSIVCKAGKSDCGGLSFLLVAVLRASGVPARPVVGRWAASEQPPAKKGEAPYSQTHVKAEFFARGIGWIPVDLSSGIIDDSRGEFAYFGNDDGDFVVMHVDTDFVLDSFVGGRLTVYLSQGVMWWQRGGSGKGERVKGKWSVAKSDPPLGR